MMLEQSAAAGGNPVGWRRAGDDRHDFKGRLVSGFVRGGGQEQLATGVNPAFNRRRFEEA